MGLEDDRLNKFFIDVDNSVPLRIGRAASGCIGISYEEPSRYRRFQEARPFSHE